MGTALCVCASVYSGGFVRMVGDCQWRGALSVLTSEGCFSYDKLLSWPALPIQSVYIPMRLPPLAIQFKAKEVKYKWMEKLYDSANERSRRKKDSMVGRYSSRVADFVNDRLCQSSEIWEPWHDGAGFGFYGISPTFSALWKKSYGEKLASLLDSHGITGSFLCVAVMFYRCWKANFSFSCGFPSDILLLRLKGREIDR